MKHPDFHDLHLTLSLKQDRSCKLITLVKASEYPKKHLTGGVGNESSSYQTHKSSPFSESQKKNTIRISERKHPTQLDCKTHKDGGGIVWASQNHCTTLRA